MVPIAGRSPSHAIRRKVHAASASAPLRRPGRSPLRLRIPERYRDPGAWQYADYLLDQGIAATANASASKLESSRQRIARSILRHRPMPHLRRAKLGCSAFACVHAIYTEPPPACVAPPFAGRRRHAQRHALRRPHAPNPNTARRLRAHRLVPSIRRLRNARRAARGPAVLARPPPAPARMDRHHRHPDTRLCVRTAHWLRCASPACAVDDRRLPRRSSAHRAIAIASTLSARRHSPSSSGRRALCLKPASR